MTIRDLGKVDALESLISRSICIVGAGVAGLVAATRLARLGMSVVLLESGKQQDDGSLPSRSCIDGPVVNDGGPRRRGIGGNSHLWGGKLLPLSPRDFQARPYLDLDGWPCARYELDRYRRDIETMMGLDHQSFEDDVSNFLDPAALLPRYDADFSLRWPKMPTAKNFNLGRVFRKEISGLKNLMIWTDATSVGFEVEPSSGRLSSLRAVSANGRTLTVRADEYLITAGTLESTRLLLLLDRHINDAMPGHAVLGRYFNDHLGLNVAALRPHDEAATNRAFADRFLLASRRHLHFELTPELQQRAEVNSGYFDIGVELADSSGYASAKRLFHSLRGRRLHFNFSDVRAIASDGSTVAQAAGWRYLLMQNYWPPNANVQMKFWIEQTPRWANRLYLSDKCDALGLPMLKIEWRTSHAEEKTIDVMYKAAQEYWAGHFSRLCTLEWRPEFLVQEASKADLADGHAHPAGSTRMGKNSKTSVVDADLKVHGMPNVSVASASVFPTSGSANPTYTIMQIAMRAADAIAKRIRRAEYAIPARSAI